MNGMGWDGMECDGMECDGMGWNEVEKAIQERTVATYPFEAST